MYMYIFDINPIYILSNMAISCYSCIFYAIFEVVYFFNFSTQDISHPGIDGVEQIVIGATPPKKTKNKTNQPWLEFLLTTIQMGRSIKYSI